MITMTNGLHKQEDIETAIRNGSNMIGLLFSKKYKDSVKMISSQAGILPDYAKEMKFMDKGNTACDKKPLFSLVGIFDDDMPQDIITRIYNYNLNHILLNGNESAVMIRNLKSSVIPDIKKDLKIIKQIVINDAKDIEAWNEYKDTADMFVFTIKPFITEKEGNALDIIDTYNGNIPFLVACTDSKDQIEKAKETNHPQFAGVSIIKNI